MGQLIADPLSPEHLLDRMTFVIKLILGNSKVLV